MGLSWRLRSVQLGNTNGIVSYEAQPIKRRQSQAAQLWNCGAIRPRYAGHRRRLANLNNIFYFSLAPFETMTSTALIQEVCRTSATVILKVASDTPESATLVQPIEVARPRIPEADGQAEPTRRARLYLVGKSATELKPKRRYTSVDLEDFQ